MKTVGEKIAYLRKERKLSQEALGLEIGVSRSAIVKWEKGLMNPNVCCFFRLITYIIRKSYKTESRS